MSAEVCATATVNRLTLARALRMPFPCRQALTLNKRLATLIVASFATGSAFAADAKHEESAAVPAAAALAKP